MGEGAQVKGCRCLSILLALALRLRRPLSKFVKMGMEEIHTVHI